MPAARAAKRCRRRAIDDFHHRFRPGIAGQDDRLAGAAPGRSRRGHRNQHRDAALCLESPEGALWPRTCGAMARGTYADRGRFIACRPTHALARAVRDHASAAMDVSDVPPATSSSCGCIRRIPRGDRGAKRPLSSNRRSLLLHAGFPSASTGGSCCDYYEILCTSGEAFDALGGAPQSSPCVVTIIGR